MDIYIIKTSCAENIPDKLLSQYQYKNFSSAQKKQEHTLSYLMLHKILENVYGISEIDIEFINQKPFLKHRKKYFSISHSKEFIAIAISDYNCSIDIEKVKTRDYISISKRMGFNSNSLDEFYRQWTMFEAEYKLNEKPKSAQIIDLNEYKASALSVNSQEKFDIYIQN